MAIVVFRKKSLSFWLCFPPFDMSSFMSSIYNDVMTFLIYMNESQSKV